MLAGSVVYHLVCRTPAAILGKVFSILTTDILFKGSTCDLRSIREGEAGDEQKLFCEAGGRHESVRIVEAVGTDRRHATIGRASMTMTQTMGRGAEDGKEENTAEQAV